MRTIPEDAAAVLRGGVLSPTALTYTLPPKQLDKKLYQSVNKVLADYGGKWNKSKKAHVFDNAHSLKGLETAINTGKTANQQQAKQAFFTPHWLVEQMIELACLEDGSVILEPSAGIGNIAFPLYDLGHEVHCVELDKQHHDQMNADCCNRNLSVERMYLKQGDFLKLKTEAIYDAVVMNPPFTKGQDYKHILHAWRFLKPGGRLIAIAGAGATKQKLYETFLASDRVGEYDAAPGSSIDTLPPKSFINEGTSVNTIIVKLTKRAP